MDSPADEKGAEVKQPLKPKKGRPKGAKVDVDKTASVEFSTVCPSCKKSGGKVVAGRKARVTSCRREVDGILYNRVKRSYVKCSHCPQVYIKLSYAAI